MINIHPIFVHFPIALFTIYALFEIIRIKRFEQTDTITYIKSAFLIIGSISSMLAVQTGELVGETMEDGPLGRLLETHAFFAVGSSYIFGALAIVYLIWLIEKTQSFTKYTSSGVGQSIWNLLLKIKAIFWKKGILILLAIVGLFFITVTGSLGGALVYGPDVDPVVKFFYTIFVGV